MARDVYDLASCIALLSLVVIAMATFYGSVQMHASSDERGREMAILIVCFNAAYAFGSLGQGAVADAVGVRISLIGAGLLLAGLGVVGLRVGRGALDHVPAVGPEGGAH